ncbi:hypothetical protein H8E77_07355 [bacterium]|nr:hypothetical protein [bacterium]
MQRRSSIDNNYCSIGVIASWGWTIYKIFNKAKENDVSVETLVNLWIQEKIAIG